MASSFVCNSVQERCKRSIFKPSEDWKDFGPRWDPLTGVMWTFVAECRWRAIIPWKSKSSNDLMTLKEIIKTINWEDLFFPLRSCTSNLEKIFTYKLIVKRKERRIKKKGFNPCPVRKAQKVVPTFSHNEAIRPTRTWAMSRVLKGKFHFLKWIYMPKHLRLTGVGTWHHSNLMGSQDFHLGGACNDQVKRLDNKIESFYKRVLEISRVRVWLHMQANT